MKRVVFCIFVFAVGIFPLLAQDSASPVKNGWYIGGGVNYSSIQGDFDGTSDWGDSLAGLTLLLPALDYSIGYSGLLGNRGNHFDREINFMYTPFTGKWKGGSYDTTAILVGFDLKWRPFIGSPIQPYLLSGLGLHFINIKGGGYTVSNGNGDGKLSGVYGRIGLGASYYFTPSIFLSAQSSYRFMPMLKLEGPGVSYSSGGMTTGSGFDFAVTGGYTL